MKKKIEFLAENFQFLVVKFSVYLNRRVFVMYVLIKMHTAWIHQNNLMSLRTIDYLYYLAEESFLLLAKNSSNIGNPRRNVSCLAALHTVIKLGIFI